MKVAAFICAYHEERRIGPAISQLLPHVDRILLMLSERPWRGDSLGDPPDHTAELVREYFPKVEIVRGTWANETTQRNDALERLADYDRVWVNDADEYYTYDAIRQILAHPMLSGACVSMRTYWKTPEWRYEPADTWQPVVLLHPRRSAFREYRDALGSEAFSVIPGVAMHHFSYVLSDAEAMRKMRSFSHTDIVRPEWFEAWRTWRPGSMINICPWGSPLYVGAVYDPAPAEIHATYLAWQRIVDMHETIGDLEKKRRRRRAEDVAASPQGLSKKVEERCLR